MFQESNPGVFKKLRRKALWRNQWSILTRLLFPRSVTVWLLLGIYWYIVLVHQYPKIFKAKIQQELFWFSVYQLIFIYCLYWMVSIYKSRKGIKMMGESYLLKGKIEEVESVGKNPSKKSPSLYHVSVKCPHRGIISNLSFRGKFPCTEGDECYAIATKGDASRFWGFIYPKAKIAKAFTRNFSMANFIRVFGRYLGKTDSQLIQFDNAIAEVVCTERVATNNSDYFVLDSWEVPIERHVQKMSWEEVIVQDNVKREIQRVSTLMLNPHKYIDLGKRAPKGLLFYGPPGTGKTTIAKAMASKLKLRFISVTAGELEHALVGGSEARVRKLFYIARREAPCIVFIDEIDALLVRRGSNLTSTYKDDVVNEFLQQMDGVTSQNQGKIIIVGATNRRERMDEAALRPGRFDKQIEIPLPDVQLREKLWELFLSGKPLGQDIDLMELANLSEGFSGAEIYGGVDEATDVLIDHIEMGDIKERVLTENMLLEALKRIRKNKT